MRFIDLFAGVGGFRLGMERAGHECVWSCEIDRWCQAVYKYRFGKTPAGDARRVDPATIPDFDILCAGFPCKSFSVAGKRKGFQDTRGTLFYEISRIAEAKRPRLLLLENVRGLLSNDRGQTFLAVLRELGRIGYWAEWQVLNSKGFGVPQNRPRVFLVGHLRKGSESEVFPIRTSSSKILSQKKIIALGNYEPSGYREGGLVVSIEGLSPTLRGTRINNVPQILTKEGIRRLTPKECERLQGFPDDWSRWGIDGKGNKIEISDTQRYNMMGNAVTVGVVEFIAGGIK